MDVRAWLSRKNDFETRSAIQALTLRCDSAAVVRDNPAGDRKPKPCPSPIPSTREKGFEQVFQNFAGHAASVVLQRQSHRLVRRLDRDFDETVIAIRIKRLQGIG